MPLFILEIVFVICLLIFFFSQIVFPLFGYYNGRLFWMFKKEEKVIEEKQLELDSLNIIEEEINLDKSIKDKKEELEKLKVEEKPVHLKPKRTRKRAPRKAKIVKEKPPRSNKIN